MRGLAGGEVREMAEPRISVVMSVYNGERFLREAVDSILGQTFTDFEFIIIDDGSTDSTRAILESYDDPRIVIMHQENIGLTKSLNRGLATARGELIARMDDDDISLNQRLEKQVEFLDAHPDVGVLGIKGHSIDEYGKIKGRCSNPCTHEEIVGNLLLDNMFIHSSVVFRKALVDEYGAYREYAYMGQDYDLFLRLSRLTRLANLSEPLHRRRMGCGISIRRGGEQVVLRDKIRRLFLEKHYSTDSEFVRLVLANLKGDPLDEVLNEYVERLSSDVNIVSGLIIRLKRKWLTKVPVFKSVRILGRKILGQRLSRLVDFLIIAKRGEVTARQGLNFILRGVQGNRERVLYGPDTLCIYVTDRCNLKCWHCRQATDACYNGAKNEMGFDMYKKVLKKFTCAQNVSLSGYGEPLLNKDLFRFASFARSEYGMKTSVITNGILSGKFVNEICDNFDNVLVSIHGLDGEDFVRVTGAPRETFDDFVEGVSSLASRFVDAGRGDCLRASYLINRENFKSAEKCTELAKSLGVKILGLQNFISYTKDEYEPTLYDSDTKIFDWLCDLQKRNEGDLKVELPTPIKREPGRLRRSCNSYFNVVGVDHNGSLTGCRRFLPPDSSFGHFEDADAWNNEKFQEMRRTFIDKSVECKDFCRYCVDCQ